MDEVEQRRAYKKHVLVERRSFQFLPFLRRRITSIFLVLMLVLISEFIAAGFGLRMELPIMLTILLVLVLSLVISIADRWSERN